MLYVSYHMRLIFSTIYLFLCIGLWQMYETTLVSPCTYAYDMYYMQKWVCQTIQGNDPACRMTLSTVCIIRTYNIHSVEYTGVRMMEQFCVRTVHMNRIIHTVRYDIIHTLCLAMGQFPKCFFVCIVHSINVFVFIHTNLVPYFVVFLLWLNGCQWLTVGLPSYYRW